MRFYMIFLPKIPKYDFLKIFEKTDPAGRPIDRSEKKVGGLGGFAPPAKTFFFFILVSFVSLSQIYATEYSKTGVLEYFCKDLKFYRASGQLYRI